MYIPFGLKLKTNKKQKTKINETVYGTIRTQKIRSTAQIKQKNDKKMKFYFGYGQLTTTQAKPKETAKCIHSILKEKLNNFIQLTASVFDLNGQN